MNLADYVKSAPKKSAPKKKAKNSIMPPVEKVIEKTIPIQPIIKVIEQPDYSPAVLKQMGENAKMAEQAIASMRDTVNHNGAVMAEVVKQLTRRPIRLDIQRDKKGDLISIIPIYE